MPLGMEVGLGPGDFVLDGIAAPPEKGTAPPPQFSVQVYCGHCRPSQLLLSSCYVLYASVVLSYFLLFCLFNGLAAYCAK